MTDLGRVLVVDDDEGMLNVCRRVLATVGWAVTTVLDGRGAIDLIRDREFDCIVADVNMPELDGFDLVDAVHRLDDDLPVLLMTGDPSFRGAVRAIEAGAVSYLTKPFESGALAAAVARAARRHGVARMRRRAASQDDAQPHLLDAALERLYLVFQPIVEASTRRVFAYEALLRTAEPSLARPDVLIATAERLDRVAELGRAVRALAAEAVPRLPADTSLFVNVHGLELADEALFDPEAPLAAHASRVVLELTERIDLDAMGGPARAAMLRRLGYRIAVDDLGAGYSALGALATFEPELVKLDMALVRDVDRHPAKHRIVGAIATLCRELGCRVVAEGVETTRELAVVREAGVDLIQGYLIARPSRELISPAW
jgi:EAL domain-containing protein (putative c-di-GMP-specific phosphodiesterase class I)